MYLFSTGDSISLRGQLGLQVPPELGEATTCSDSTLCWTWGNVAKLAISKSQGTIFVIVLRRGGKESVYCKILDDVCYDIMWTSTILKSFEDCFNLEDEHYWFVGPEEYEQHFPIKADNQRRPVPYLPGDMLQVSRFFLINEWHVKLLFIQDREGYFGGVTEPYWLSSEGVALWLMGNDPTQGQPLFVSWNHLNNKVSA